MRVKGWTGVAEGSFRVARYPETIAQVSRSAAFMVAKLKLVPFPTYRRGTRMP